MLATQNTFRLVVCAAALGACVNVLTAQQEEPPADWEKYADALPFPTDPITVPSWRRTDGPHVRAAFRDVVANVSLATVRVRSDGEKAALGGIVDPNGWILTKASRLTGALICKFADGRQLEARIVGIDREYDIALLKVEAENLPTLELSENPVPLVGSWLATAGTGRDPIAVGVVSVPPREIPHRPGILGVELDVQSGNAKVVRVLANSGAAQAGLEVDDVITAVNDTATRTREDLIRTVQTFSPGDKVKLQVRREGETLEIDAVLTGALQIRSPTRDEFQNQLGSGLSHRRFGFPNAFQHDTVVVPTDCGGPLVDLDGKVAGFNIARAGRTETYALTNESISNLLDQLMPDDPSATEQPTLE